MQTGGIEVLESRIAPSVFFVSGAASGATALKVYDSSGHVVAGDTAAATTAGATAAILLHPGDSLVFDPDHNHRISAGDFTMVKDNAGDSLVFLTPFANPKAFDLSSLGGIAVSDGSDLKVNTGVRGDIVTALDGSDHFTTGGSPEKPTVILQDASIADLQVKGNVHSILAGENVNSVTVSGRVWAVGAGTGAGKANLNPDTGETIPGQIILSNAQHPMGIGLVPLAGAGGSIANLQAATASILITGDGSPGFDGGSITRVHLGNVTTLAVTAGAGGSGSGTTPGGNGGSISQFPLFFNGTGRNPLQGVGLFAGTGGNSELGNGGAGGSISSIPISAYGLPSLVELFAGDGGHSTDDATTANGGAGGSVSNITAHVTAVGFNGATLSIEGGRGGSSGAHFGATGSSNSTGAGGAGGALTSVVLTAAGPEMTFGRFDSGLGGLGGAGGAGAGGDISHITSMLSGGMFVSSGGNMDHVTIYDSRLLSSLGARGSMSDIKVVGYGDGADSGLIIQAYQGGDISNLTVENLGGVLPKLLIGAGQGQTGAGDAGGSISGVTVYNAGTIQEGGIFSGAGGGGGDVASGASGEVSRVKILDFGVIGSAKHPFDIAAGGTPNTSTIDGGAGIGAVDNVTIWSPVGSYLIGTVGADIVKADSTFGSANTAGGSTAAGGMAGHGGDLSHVTATVGSIRFEAPAGGSAPLGTGGAGGSIANVTASVTAGVVGAVEAGDGGDGTIPGTGGSISHFSTKGSIGYFSRAYGFDYDESNPAAHMGGLAVGRGGAGPADTFGTAGSIDTVSALRIAAIVAGTGQSLGYDNAVTSISNVHAAVIGADTHIKGLFRQGAFDFNNPNSGTDGIFEPDAAHDPIDGDVPLDGLVLVKAGGLLTPLPVKPLLLVQV
jgi:hypothetical protein